MTSEERSVSGPELDYAFLAEFAKVEPNGTLIAIGASYTEITAQQIPAGHSLHVAGRIRAPEGRGPMNLAFTFRGPTDGSPTVRIGGELITEGARPYAGKIGVLFAVGTTMPLLSEGLHTIDIELEDQIVRRLAFEVRRLVAE
jgi:hypothetical protein